jgi:hypothetical protein
MSGPATNTIEDTLYDEGGNLVNGYITVTNEATFTTNDGYTILQGFSLYVPVNNGVLNCTLIVSPSGQQYTAQYVITDQVFAESWVVPADPNPCTLEEVRVS